MYYDKHTIRSVNTKWKKARYYQLPCVGEKSKYQLGYSLQVLVFLDNQN